MEDGQFWNILTAMAMMMMTLTTPTPTNADDGVVGHDWDRLIHRIDVVVKRKVDASFHADNENYSILCAAEKKKKKLGDGIGCAEGEERNWRLGPGRKMCHWYSSWRLRSLILQLEMLLLFLQSFAFVS